MHVISRAYLFHENNKIAEGRMVTFETQTKIHLESHDFTVSKEESDK